MAFGEETAVEALMLERFGPDAVWFDPDFINFHAVRPEKYLWRNLLREQFQRGTARARLIQDGIGNAATSRTVPECLKPQPIPQKRAEKRFATSRSRRASAPWAQTCASGVRHDPARRRRVGSLFSWQLTISPPCLALLRKNIENQCGGGAVPVVK